MIAVLLIVYTGIVVGVFKLKLLKPRPVPIAGCVIAGILIIGTVLIFWFQMHRCRAASSPCSLW